MASVYSYPYQYKGYGVKVAYKGYQRLYGASWQAGYPGFSPCQGRGAVLKNAAIAVCAWDTKHF